MSQASWPTPARGAPLLGWPETQRRSANILQLTRNELFKLWKRRLVWGLLGLDLFFVLAAWLVLVFYAIKTRDGFDPGHLLGGATGLMNAVGQPMTLGRRGGEFIAVALGGLAFCGEVSRDPESTRLNFSHTMISH